jgi:MFS family permease
VLRTASVVTAPTLVLYGLAPSLWSAALTLVVLAGCYMATLSSCTNITQRSASAEVRGRAMIVNNFVLGMAYPVGVLLQGWLADLWSLRTVTVASGVVLGGCFAVLAVARPRLTDPIARLDRPTEVAHVH